MFKRHDTRVSSNAVCLNAVENLLPEDFNYYDKDGFELNVAEQKFYSAMNFPITYPILNHCCWQEPWFELEPGDHKLLLDHSMILARCEYARDALEQVRQFIPHNPYAQLLTKVRSKWGFDFALDAVADSGEVFEVIHIEFDNYHYDIFNARRLQFDYIVRHTDWIDAANRIWQQREQWQHLKGFEQNHWKANYLIGWEKAEYLEKAV